MSAYQVRLPAFEGPFDLLYHLIEEQKINIYDIPIAKIASQYLEYLQMMEILDMEVASGFLIMAATLLEIKSKMLLPQENINENSAENEDFLVDEQEFDSDARSKLVEQLLEYKKFKTIALKMREMERCASRIYTRRSDIERLPEEILEINIDTVDLLNIFQALVKQQLNPPVHRVVLEKLSLAERIDEIRAMLKAIKNELKFDTILKQNKSRFEKVLSFMAILEMSKDGELTLFQSGNFKPIFLRPPEKLMGGGLKDANSEKADELNGEKFAFNTGDVDEQR